MQGTILYLIRHGETDWNRQHRSQGREDIPLNEQGILQAQTLGQTLQQLGLRAVAASPLQRAKKTAQILAEYAGVPSVTEDPGLIERDLGAASGQVARSVEDYFSPFSGKGMEPMEALCSRMEQALLRWRDGPGPVALVSHGMAINALLYRVSGGQAGSGKTLLKNCCVSILRAYSGRLELLACNLTAEEAVAFTKENTEKRP